VIGKRKEDAVTRLMRWYASQCDGEWEREFGLRIDTMDNPGWSVRIDLAYTGVDPASIAEQVEHRDKNNWIECKSEPGCVWTSDSQDFYYFIGYGGLHNLAEIIEYFLSHANRPVG